MMKENKEQCRNAHRLVLASAYSNLLARLLYCTDVDDAIESLQKLQEVWRNEKVQELLYELSDELLTDVMDHESWMEAEGFYADTDTLERDGIDAAPLTS